MMVKGEIKATSAGSGKTVILDRKQSSTLAGKYGDSVAKAIQKAAEKGKAVNKTALVALLTTKGSKLDVDKARQVADKIIGNAKPAGGQVGNPLKDKSSKQGTSALNKDLRSLKTSGEGKPLNKEALLKTMKEPPKVLDVGNPLKDKSSKMWDAPSNSSAINQSVVGKAPATEGELLKAAGKNKVFVMREDRGNGPEDTLVKISVVDKKNGDYGIKDAVTGATLGDIGFNKENKDSKARWDNPDGEGAETYREFIPAGKLSDHNTMGGVVVLPNKGGKKLVDMASIYNLPSGNPTDKMTPAQIKERAAKIRANAESMKGKGALGNKSSKAWEDDPRDDADSAREKWEQDNMDKIEQIVELESVGDGKYSAELVFNWDDEIEFDQSTFRDKATGKEVAFKDMSEEDRDNIDYETNIDYRYKYVNKELADKLEKVRADAYEALDIQQWEEKQAKKDYAADRAYDRKKNRD